MKDIIKIMIIKNITLNMMKNQKIMGMIKTTNMLMVGKIMSTQTSITRKKSQRRKNNKFFHQALA